MKKLNLIVLTGAVLALGACASCPTTGDYYQTPYGHERTAGHGTAVYDGKCRTVAPRKEPAPVVKSAEPVFEQRARK